MRIGLPRALIFYYYYPLWKSFFENLGMDVVVSDVTSKELIEKGIKVTVPEICVPIKIFNGHVINLLSKNVDYVFIPRFVSIDRGEWFCPKFIGLPDLVKYTIEEAKERILTIDIKGKREDTCNWRNYRPLCNILHVSEKQLKKALKNASEYWHQFRQYSMEGFTIEEAMQICDNKLTRNQILSQRSSEITIGLLGYVYNIYDPFVSMDIIPKMRSMGVNIITFEMLKEEEMSRQLPRKSKNIYWTFSKKIHQSARVFMKERNVDGLIHVTAFGCGPDSIVGKMIELDSDVYQKPFMTIRVDEHTGESHLITRVEAFVDMIKRKKYSEKRGEIA
ncbi:MAG: hypothetical protein GX066_08655 [Clostridiaceae bacterium]|nr:hypothetical protein [Clostridiaceae bacterium]